MKNKTYNSINFTYLIICFQLLTTVTVSTTQRDIWHNSFYIWNFGLISANSKGLNKNPAEYFVAEDEFDKQAYQNINAGDIVWLSGRFVIQFCREILPGINVPIVLLIADGDESFPSNCGGDAALQVLVENPYVIHVFAQNNEYGGSNKKISHIPIGIDYHTIGYKSESGGWGEKGTPPEQEEQLRSVLNTLKATGLRKKRAFVDFQFSDSMHGEYQFGEDRKSIFNRLLKTGLIDYSSWMKRSDLWKTKGEYAFSISPHGNGLDCHRTWEDLILGCIVIVKTSPLDPLYEGLPVVIVQDWAEITDENLDEWLMRYGDAFTNQTYREKLTSYYWLSKIYEKALPYKTCKNE